MGRTPPARGGRSGGRGEASGRVRGPRRVRAVPDRVRGDGADAGRRRGTSAAQTRPRRARRALAPRYLRAIAPLGARRRARAGAKLIAHRLRASLDAANAERSRERRAEGFAPRSRAAAARRGAGAADGKKAADGGDDARRRSRRRPPGRGVRDEVAAAPRSSRPSRRSRGSGASGRVATRSPRWTRRGGFAGVPRSPPTLAALPAAVSALTDAFEDETKRRRAEEGRREGEGRRPREGRRLRGFGFPASRSRRRGRRAWRRCSP